MAQSCTAIFQRHTTMRIVRPAPIGEQSEHPRNLTGLLYVQPTNIKSNNRSLKGTHVSTTGSQRALDAS